MEAGIATFLVFAVIATAFGVGSVPHEPHARPRRRQSYLQLTTYECGEEAEGEAQVDFPTQHYTFAIVFVAVDVIGFVLALWDSPSAPSTVPGYRCLWRSPSPRSRSRASTTRSRESAGGSYERPRERLRIAG